MTELYDQIVHGYAVQRRPEPQISTLIKDQLQGVSSVLNVGAGYGSYEPAHLPVVAAEPAAKMISQRSTPSDVVQARAEALPFADGSFDAVMAVLTLHHWQDKTKGLKECVRVARKRIVLFTWDPASDGFWLVQEYLPVLLAYDRSIFPGMEFIREAIDRTTVHPLPIPADCRDGFLGAYWRRPEAYLDPDVRRSISSFSRITGRDSGLEKLRGDLASGDWRRKYGHLLAIDALDIGYRLVIGEPD